MGRKEKMTKRRLPEGAKIFIIRWWTAGAVCFLVAFGTNFGAGPNPVDLVFLLSAVLSCVMIFIYNPCMMMLYDIRRAGRIVNNEYRTQSVNARIMRHVREIIKCYAVSFIVYLTYMGINMAYIKMTGAGSEELLLPVEPILYGLMFSLYYEAFSAISDYAVIWYRNRKTVE